MTKALHWSHEKSGGHNVLLGSGTSAARGGRRTALASSFQVEMISYIHRKGGGGKNRERTALAKQGWGEIQG